MDLASGSKGGTCVVCCPPRRTRSIAELVRKTDTFSPAVSPPLAIVKAIDESSESMPFAYVGRRSIVSTLDPRGVAACAVDDRCDL
jgi:hypothetical protein